MAPLGVSWQDGVCPAGRPGADRTAYPLVHPQPPVKVTMQIWPGKPYPLGATYDGSGVNFALFSEIAERVEVCLIADDGTDCLLYTSPSPRD